MSALQTAYPSLAKEGCQQFCGLLTEGISRLEHLLERADNGRPGERLASNDELSHWLRCDGWLSPALERCFPNGCFPVRAILFDKSPQQNWALGWHQDRTICVRSRVDVLGFGPFSIKQGLVHVEPPFQFIERMRTLRIHLDPVTEDNAPLIVASGSHTLGRIPADEVAEIAEASTKIVCLAERGDVWAYATSILHASERSTFAGRRRVLQVDYTNDSLPDGLAWLGIGGLIA